MFYKLDTYSLQKKLHFYEKVILSQTLKQLTDDGQSWPTLSANKISQQTSVMQKLGN